MVEISEFARGWCAAGGNTALGDEMVAGAGAVTAPVACFDGFSLCKGVTTGGGVGLCVAAGGPGVAGVSMETSPGIAFCEPVMLTLAVPV